MKRKLKKFLCVSLSAIMIMQILPMSVMGAEVQNRTLPEVISTDDKEINIIQELTDESTDNESVYLADDGSIVKTIELPDNDSDQIATVSTFANNSNLSNSDGQITIYQEDDTENEPDIYTMSTSDANGIIVNVDTENLGNVFVKNAYITLHCEEIFKTTDIYAYSIANEYDNDYSAIELDQISDFANVTTDNGNSDIVLDITKPINSWLTGTENYGICVYSEEELTYSNPTLTINYRNISDVDSNIECEIIEMGRGGTVYINDFSCAPTIVRNELGLDGYLAPVQIQSILNPFSDSNSLTGSNFRINYESSITYNSQANYYVWNNCEGEILNFTLHSTTSQNKTYTAVNTAGSTFTLTISVSGSANIQNAKVTDEDGYEYHFNSYGLLSEILVNGNNSNKIVITYSNTENAQRIASIKDGAGRIYKFEYDENNRLEKIKVVNSNNDALTINNEEIFVEYIYNDAGLLSQVTYPDNETVEYTYDDSGRIETIVSNSGNTLEFSYYIDNQNIISDYILSDSNEKTLENISLKLPVTEENDANGPYRRVFTDNINRENEGNQIKILDFDKEFNLIYLENYDNKNYFLDYKNGILKNVINDSPSKDLINNGNFTKDMAGWKKFTGSSATQSTNKERRLRSNFGCLKLAGASSKVAGVVQEVTSENGFKKDEKYIIEAYLEAQSAVPLTNDKKMGVIVATSKNESGVPVSSDIIAQMDYQPYISAWQLQKHIITIPENTDALYVYLYYGYLPESCYFDSVKLYKYTEKETAADIDKNEYTYDSYGRLTKEAITEKTPILGTVKAIKEKSYIYNGNNLTSVTDNGITTYYNYDSNNSLLMSYGSSSNSNDNIQYTYNGIGALESVSQIINQIDNESQNGLKNMQINTDYSYSHDNVTEITHNGFTYNLSYDGLGNISEISIDNKKIFEFDHQNYDINALGRTSQSSKITYGDGTSLIYEEYIDDNYFNILRIYETKRPDATVENINTSPTYEFKYDYDGSLVEYIDNVNNTVSVWQDDVYAIYNSTDSIYKDIYNVLLGTTNLSDLTEIPIYQYSENYSGTVLGQSYTQSNVNIYDSSFSILSSSTYSKVTNKTTDTDRIYYGERNIDSSSDLSSLINGTDYSVVKTETDSFGRTSESSIVSVLGATAVKNKYTYKDLGSKKTTDLIEKYETYYGGINSSSEELTNAASLLSKKYTYEYNSKGQITDVSLSTINRFDESTYDDSNETTSKKVQHYEYDELGQIVEEVNIQAGKAILYYYDNGGNITEKRIYQNDTSNDNASPAFTFDSVSNELTLLNCTDNVVYGYDDSSWKDLLTSYNGVDISYDNAGNPLNYSGTNIFNKTIEGTMEWEGKKLASFTTADGTTRYEYKYNADGLRTQKKIVTIDSNGDESDANAIDYIWDNDVIVGYRITSYKDDGTVKTVISMKPLYDNNNNLMGIMYENPNAEEGEQSKITIPILRDGLGNITDMYTSLDDSDTMFHYDYDAYGNCVLNFSGINLDFTGDIAKDIILAILYVMVVLAIAAGTAIVTQQNYRGYLYDIETGLYYNQTRYYSPSWCRFLSCDDLNVLTKDTGEVLGANLFKYCDNDPINFTDSSGFSKLSNMYNSNSILSLMGVHSTEATKLNIAKTSMQNTVKTQMLETSLALTLEPSTELDSNQQKVWGKIFNEKPQTVHKHNGYNYISSQLYSTGNDKTKIFSTKSTTPYNTKTAKNN